MASKPMHPSGTILILLARYPVWSETFLHRDLFALRDADPRIRLAALHSGEAEGGGVPDGVGETAITVLSGSGPASPASPLVRFPRLPGTSSLGWSLLRHARLNRALERFCDRHQVRHIHAEFCDLPALLAGTVARRNGLSFSVGAHARDVFCCKYPLHALFRGAVFALACNSAVRNALVEQNAVSADRVHLIHHGLPTKRMPFRSLAFHGPVRLLWAGRLVPKKGVDILLRALAQLSACGESETVPDWTLRIVGEGSERERLRRLSSQLGLESRVEWQTPLPPDRLQQAMLESDVLAVPARVAADGDRDGIPNVVLEAMSLGLSVVATTTGGLRDVIAPETAWVAASPTPASFAAAIQECLQAPRHAHADRRQKARRLVEREFDLAVVTAQRHKTFDSEVLGVI